ncbi:hypothetical protein EV127DRAFT_443946 [Xylaria flabelliformis]|nr:hypothetical protein EV127DRAFT_443946 [Xylaria flabelliformis]
MGASSIYLHLAWYLPSWFSLPACLLACLRPAAPTQSICRQSSLHMYLVLPTFYYYLSVPSLAHAPLLYQTPPPF